MPRVVRAFDEQRQGRRSRRVCARQAIREREVCVYSISCKSQNNINLTLDWLTKHAKS